MGRPRLYKDLQTQWRERKRKQRADKKPYRAKQRVIQAQLQDPALQSLKAAQGVYDVCDRSALAGGAPDPEGPAAARHRTLSHDVCG